MPRRHKPKSYSMPPEIHDQISRRAARMGVSASEYLRLAAKHFEESGGAPVEQGRMPMLTKLPGPCIGRKSDPDYDCPRRGNEHGDQCYACYQADADIRQKEQARRKRMARRSKLY